MRLSRNYWIRALASQGTDMSKAAKWAIGIGVLLAFLGMVGITAGFPSRQTDPGPIAAGLAVFALGLLAVTATFYFEARSIRSQLPVDAHPRGSARRKHSCDVCHNAPAVILCTMHKTSLCPACLPGHYDSRGCVYVPAIRRASARPAKGAAASRS